MGAEHTTPTIDGSQGSNAGAQGHTADGTADGTADATAAQNAGSERQSQKLNLRGFDNIATFSGGEEQLQNWSWKIKTAVSGMNGELAEMLNAADTTRIVNTEEILGEDQFVDANRERCRKALKL